MENEAKEKKDIHPNTNTYIDIVIIMMERIKAISNRPKKDE